METTLDDYLSFDTILVSIAIFTGLLALAAVIYTARRKSKVGRDNMKLSQRRWLLTRVWAKDAVALLSACLAIGASVVVTFAVSQYALFQTPFGGFFGAYPFLFLAIVNPTICLYGAILVGRILLRIHPVAPEHTETPAELTKWVFIGGLSSYIIFILIPLFPPDSVRTSVSLEALHGFWVTSCLFAWTGFLMHRHYAGFQTLLDSQYVVFLRRFSTFSDRVVTGFLMRNLPAGIPIVILQSHVSGIRDWDPFAMGLGGMKVLFPIKSMPLVLSVSDNRWIDWVQRLAEKSSGVIVDLTEISASVRNELEILKTRGLDRKLVLVADENALRSLETIEHSLLTSGIRESYVLPYRRSWLAAIPKLLLSLWLLALLCLLLTFPDDARSHLEAAVPSGAVPHYLISRLETLHESQIAGGVLTLFAISFGIYGVLVTVKPTLAKESQIAIGNALDELFAETATPLRVAWSRLRSTLQRKHEDG